MVSGNGFALRRCWIKTCSTFFPDARGQTSVTTVYEQVTGHCWPLLEIFAHWPLPCWPVYLWWNAEKAHLAEISDGGMCLCVYVCVCVCVVFGWVCFFTLCVCLTLCVCVYTIKCRMTPGSENIAAYTPQHWFGLWNPTVTSIVILNLILVAYTMLSVPICMLCIIV